MRRSSSRDPGDDRTDDDNADADEHGPVANFVFKGSRQTEKNADPRQGPSNGDG
jgi:hypothetical protein